MGSDNLDGAENQQERLISTGWVIGFVDGEGCFSIGFNRQSDREDRNGYRTGYQVSHRFAVTQGASSLVCRSGIGFTGWVRCLRPAGVVHSSVPAPIWRTAHEVSCLRW